MAVRDDVLRNLARVFLHLFGKEIDREALLEHSIAVVLFIRQYALDGFILPPCFFPRSRNAGFCQYLRNGVDGFAAHEQPVNEPDCFRFFRVDLRQTIWAFSVSEKLSVGHIDLVPSANRFRCPHVTLSDMERLSSCASDDIIKIRSSPLPSNVHMFSFSK